MVFAGASFGEFRVAGMDSSAQKMGWLDLIGKDWTIFGRRLWADWHRLAIIQQLVAVGQNNCRDHVERMLLKAEREWQHWWECSISTWQNAHFVGPWGVRFSFQTVMSQNFIPPHNQRDNANFAARCPKRSETTVIHVWLHCLKFSLASAFLWGPTQYSPCVWSGRNPAIGLHPVRIGWHRMARLPKWSILCCISIVVLDVSSPPFSFSLI
jgi:hypothetical protein